MNTLSVVLLVLLATANGYPSTPDDMDKLCEVIGDAPNLSVPPMDRLWFKEQCICISTDKVGCGRWGSPRFEQRQRDAAAASAAREKVAQAEINKARAESKAREEKARKTRAERTTTLKNLRASIKAGALQAVRTPRSDVNQIELTTYRIAYNHCREQDYPGWLMPDDFFIMCGEIAIEVENEVELPLPRKPVN